VGARLQAAFAGRRAYKGRCLISEWEEEEDQVDPEDFFGE